MASIFFRRHIHNRRDEEFAVEGLPGARGTALALKTGAASRAVGAGSVAISPIIFNLRLGRELATSAILPDQIRTGTRTARFPRRACVWYALIHMIKPEIRVVAGFVFDTAEINSVLFVYASFHLLAVGRDITTYVRKPCCSISLTGRECQSAFLVSAYRRG